MTTSPATLTGAEIPPPARTLPRTTYTAKAHSVDASCLRTRLTSRVTGLTLTLLAGEQPEIGGE